MIALIVAYDKNRVIGNQGCIPWKIEGEQRRFKELTTGNVVVMGRRSYEEIGHPLKNRTTIVVSTTKNYQSENCFTVSSLEQAIEVAGNRDVYISGGGRLYHAALKMVDKMYITEIEMEVDGDTIFPEFDEEEYIREVEEKVDGIIPYTYLTYTRKKHSNNISKIREAEAISHIKTYAQFALFSEGSWLKQPIKTVLELMNRFVDYEKITVLDLGCGVGRNCIPFARQFMNKECHIVGVDIIELAIEKLNENSKMYGVENCISGYAMPIEEFIIEKEHYDLVMGISALEHMESEKIFHNKLLEIREGIRKEGLVCLVINSDIKEIEIDTNTFVEPQFEINLPTEDMEKIIHTIFHEWCVLKTSVVLQEYTIPRENGEVKLLTNVITFVAQNKRGESEKIE